jgi:hypothetical protein
MLDRTGCYSVSDSRCGGQSPAACGGVVYWFVLLFHVLLLPPLPFRSRLDAEQLPYPQEAKLLPRWMNALLRTYGLRGGRGTPQ